MNFTSEEIDALRMLVKVEISDTKSLIASAKGQDKKELSDYLLVVENIYKKLN